ncbi:signal peptidase I [Candidatus Curtissbacteria bacterium]|nr:signal peptidase I [Candidatus Curtissbacteria bacterium]
MKTSILAVIKDIFQTALISLGIFLLVYTFLVQPHRVRGDSMLPNFYDGELMLTEKISYRFGIPARGDVIVFRATGSLNVDYVKRVIGLPGEVIEVNEGGILINGQRLNEPYEPQQTGGHVEYRLGQNQYFVLGDNRGASSDSRSFGPIDKSSIKGKTWLVYWPITKSNQSKGLRMILKVDYSIPDTLDHRRSRFDIASGDN